MISSPKSHTAVVFPTPEFLIPRQLGQAAKLLLVVQQLLDTNWNPPLNLVTLNGPQPMSKTQGRGVSRAFKRQSDSKLVGVAELRLLGLNLQTGGFKTLKPTNEYITLSLTNPNP